MALQGSFDVVDGRLCRVSNHRVRVNANGVVEDDPGRHEPTAGHNRINRVRVVKDADGKTLKGKGGGARRKPNPADGEVLADKMVMYSMARKAWKHDSSEPFAGGLGGAVFSADAPKSWNPNAGKSGEKINFYAKLYLDGHLDIRDIHNAKLRQRIRRVARMMQQGAA